MLMHGATDPYVVASLFTIGFMCAFALSSLCYLAWKKYLVSLMCSGLTLVFAVQLILSVTGYQMLWQRDHNSSMGSLWWIIAFCSVIIAMSLAVLDFSINRLYPKEEKQQPSAQNQQDKPRLAKDLGDFFSSKGV